MPKYGIADNPRHFRDLPEAEQASVVQRLWAEVWLLRPMPSQS
ncbi:MAG TPA: hypothetical protein VFU22_16770 [Roseiflexaceae bacterium]|nr:hypothetical protein [Roseiflexaceae bacterium]